MQIGRLNKRLAIQENSRTRNDYGEAEDSWTTATTVWGSIEPIKGREMIHQSNQQVGELTHRVRMRYNSTITAQHRIQWDSRNFEIIAVMNLREADEEFEVLCKETV